MTTKPCPRRHRSDESRPTEFGEQVTADHMVISESDEGTDGQRAALVVLDRGTDWVQCYPLPNKSRDEAIKAFTHFEGGKRCAQLFYSDNAPELCAAADTMGWPHERATPGRPATNGVAERTVRSVLNGTRASLLHAGFPEHLWPYAALHWCKAHNITITDGDSAWNKHHRRGNFRGARLPFGCLVDFLPSPVHGKQPKFAQVLSLACSWDTACWRGASGETSFSCVPSQTCAMPSPTNLVSRANCSRANAYR